MGNNSSLWDCDTLKQLEKHTKFGMKFEVGIRVPVHFYQSDKQSC